MWETLEVTMNMVQFLLVDILKRKKNIWHIQRLYFWMILKKGIGEFRVSSQNTFESLSIEISVSNRWKVIIFVCRKNVRRSQSYKKELRLKKD